MGGAIVDHFRWGGPGLKPCSRDDVFAGRKAGASTENLLVLLVALVALALGAAAKEATPLTLSDAAKMTLANNPMHKAALAGTKATLAGVREARAPLLPRITFAENYTRGRRITFSAPTARPRSLARVAITRR